MFFNPLRRVFVHAHTTLKVKRIKWNWNIDYFEKVTFTFLDTVYRVFKFWYSDAVFSLRYYKLVRKLFSTNPCVHCYMTIRWNDVTVILKLYVYSDRHTICICPRTTPRSQDLKQLCFAKILELKGNGKDFRNNLVVYFKVITTLSDAKSKVLFFKTVINFKIDFSKGKLHTRFDTNKYKKTDEGGLSEYSC